ncbi:glycosyltransferase [Sphingobacterium sp. DN00404]|uniref:Glycosyltransferase n=1 Tax=Sphingobacterium micropteri TaxID=2763501 RepID=A0ABR7YKG9_9SPHI|nr:glycosyltransferase [Sphingobacterium micropteri]MBD1431749.1 glycosyltransferase [Sphingobacterium micropteri]
MSLLKSFCDVHVLSFKNLTGRAGLGQFLSQRSNKKSNKTVKYEIDRFKPDIVHIHNLHFAAGWEILSLIKQSGIPVIMTLHNYRFLCPSGTLYHNGSLFLDSLSQGFPWQAIRRKVYKDSRLLTFWLARTFYSIKRSNILNAVDRYIVLTEFAKDLFTNSKLLIADKKFEIKPNFVYPGIVDYKGERKKHFLFIGRLCEEKGVDVLLEAFKDSDACVFIAGGGPMEEKVVEYANRYKNNFVFLGKLNADEIRTEMQNATALIFPSVWYEGMPLTILEAFASSLPVIASKIGAMESMISHNYNGLHFDVASPNDLAKTVNRWKLMTEEEKLNFRKNAMETYELNYTKERNLQMMKELYQSILDESTSKQ